MTPEDRVRSVVRKIQAIAEDHLASGGTAAEWSEALAQSTAASGSTSEPVHLPTLETLGRLLDYWHTEADWLDANGEPRPLSPTGAKGFPGLCKAVGIGKDARMLANTGLSLGVLKSGPKGALAPTERTALVNRPSPMLMELMAVGIAAWQSTVRHNIAPDTPEEARRLDRGIYHHPIAASMELQYHQVCVEAGRQLIYRVSNWLKAHVPGPKQRDVRLVSLHAFAATEHTAVAPPKPRGRRGG